MREPAATRTINNTPSPPMQFVCALPHASTLPQDEKLLRFIVMVPQEWRLFWAIESVGISFALALVGIVYTGDDSSLLNTHTDNIQTFPTWFIWGLNPVAVTLSSILLSSTLRAVCQMIGTASKKAVNSECGGFIPTNTVGILVVTVRNTYRRITLEPCFHIMLGLWLTHGVHNWRCLTKHDGFPIALRLVATTRSSEEYGLGISKHKSVLLGINAVLVTGLAAKALGAVCPAAGRATATPEQQVSLDDTLQGHEIENIPDFLSRVPSLLVGWGSGYWATSLLYLLSISLHGGGWPNAPIVLSGIGYVALPCFAVILILVAADTNFLGSTFSALLKPTVDMLRNRHRVGYWILATVLRDFLTFWIVLCSSLRSFVSFW